MNIIINHTKMPDQDPESSEPEKPSEGARPLVDANIESRINELVGILGNMNCQSNLSQDIPELPGDDPFSDLFSSLDTLQDDFYTITEKYLQSKAELTKQRDLLDELIQEKTRVLVTNNKMLEVQRNEIEFILENALDVFFQISKTGEILFISEEVTALNGLTPKDMEGKLFTSFIPKKELQKLRDVLKDVFKGKEITYFETFVLGKNNEWIPVEINGIQVKKGNKSIGQGTIRNISKRKTMEKQIKDQINALDQSAIVAITDIMGKITYVNDAFCKTSKCSREELLGNHHRILNSEYHSSKFMKDLWTTIQSGKIWKGEIKNKAKDGSFYWMDTTITPFLDNDGKPQQYLAIHFNITQRKEAEIELQKAKERFELALISSKAGVWAWNIKTGEVNFNKRSTEILGYDSDELKLNNNTLLEMLHQDDIPRIMEVLNAHLESETDTYQIDHRCKTKSGELKWIRSTGKVVKWNEDNKPLLAVGTHIDITESKQAENELKLYSNYLKSVFDTSSDGICVSALDGKIETVNSTYLDIYGYNENEIKQKTIADFYPPEELSNLQKHMDTLLKKTDRVHFESTNLRKNGTLFPVSITASLMQDNAGTFIAIITNIRNITDKKRSEKTTQNLLHRLKRSNREMKESEQEMLNILADMKKADEELRLHRDHLEEMVKERTAALENAKQFNENIIQTVPSGLVVFTKKDIISISSSFRDMFQLKRGEYEGSPAEEFFENFRCVDKKVVKNILSGELTKKEDIRCYPFNRSKEWYLDISLSKINIGEADAEEEFLLVIDNVTQRKQDEEKRREMEVQMLVASKMATLGELSTGVAHEMNQPLTFISGFLQTLALDLSKNKIEPEQIEKRLSMANQQIARMTEIINHLRTFGRKDVATTKENIQIPEILDNTLMLLNKRIWFHNIHIVKNIQEALPSILGNATQLEQVFINLIQNATDVLDEKEDNRQISISMKIFKKSIKIKISDNGSGIPPEVKEKIFEPFFTTKEVGKGTGLGLSIIYGIIRDHGGTLKCDSVVGEGTTFTIKLPLE